jgi:predicted RNA binding protein YcfA (HicA-like mRNA interferase family)
MKIPRDVNGSELVKVLKKFGFFESRQLGSHIRLTYKTSEEEFHTTVPNHKPIKVGTLNSIITEVANHLKINKQEIIDLL